MNSQRVTRFSQTTSAMIETPRELETRWALELWRETLEIGALLVSELRANFVATERPSYR